VTGWSQAKGPQEELLLWINDDDKGKVWLAQYQARTALQGHMKVARETPTFIFGASLDMTGFIDGTGKPGYRRGRAGGRGPSRRRSRRRGQLHQRPAVGP
jgi:deferrochelatase/peroxidase EfeB